MSIDILSIAPSFKAFNHLNESFSLGDAKGKWIVLYFYPKDNTSGCTVEACDFRDSMESLQSLNTLIIGISPDSVKSHQKFINDHQLNFMLLSDEDKSICSAYGVWVEKSMYGRKYMGVERSTFIIDPQGIIQQKYSKVKVPGHVSEISNWLKSHQ
jgi:thioredoxin-dependent peroxiredoxin